MCLLTWIYTNESVFHSHTALESTHMQATCKQAQRTSTQKHVHCVTSLFYVSVTHPLPERDNTLQSAEEKRQCGALSETLSGILEGLKRSRTGHRDLLTFGPAQPAAFLADSEPVCCLSAGSVVMHWLQV